MQALEEAAEINRERPLGERVTKRRYPTVADATGTGSDGWKGTRKRGSGGRPMSASPPRPEISCRLPPFPKTSPQSFFL